MKTSRPNPADNAHGRNPGWRLRLRGAFLFGATHLRKTGLRTAMLNS